MSKSQTKKVKRFRGSGSCGGGSRKKRRGRGHKGGSGNAGALKQNYIRTCKLGLKPGKHGFNRPDAAKEEVRDAKYLENRLRELKKEGKITEEVYRYLSSKPVLNIADLDLLVIKLSESEFVSEENGVYNIDLSNIGYKKLLGSGKTSVKYNIKVEGATVKAVEKIESAGGKILE